MKTSINLIDLRIEITQKLNKSVKGNLSDNIKVMNLKHSYELLKDVYTLISLS